MADMRAFYDEVVASSKHTSCASMTDKTAAVKAFIECNCDDNLPALAPYTLHAGARQVLAGGRKLASRTDIRAMPYLAVSGAPTWPASARSAAGSNIFADPAYHVDAAATLAGLAARRSGFSIDMSPDESRSKFQAYVNQFATAPHWLYERSSTTNVEHSSTNHQQFTHDLGAVITEQMKLVNAGQDAINAAVGTLNALGSLLGNSTQNGSITNTLYTTIGASREPGNEGPLYYGIFYMTLHMDHKANGKSNVLSTEADAYTVMYRLDSPILVQNADLYERLTRTTVEDWFAGLEIY